MIDPPESDLAPCRECNGDGFVRRYDYGTPGDVAMYFERCPRCEGSGTELSMAETERKEPFANITIGMETLRRSLRASTGRREAEADDPLDEAVPARIRAVSRLADALPGMAPNTEAARIIVEAIMDATVERIRESDLSNEMFNDEQPPD